MTINWNNVAGWTRTIGQSASAVSALLMATNSTDPKTAKIALGCSIVAAVAGEVLKQITNPQTFPQTPIIKDEVKP